MRCTSYFLPLIIALFILPGVNALWVSMDSSTDQPLYAVDMRSSIEGWAVGGKGIGFSDARPTIIHTTNGGTSWTAQTVPSSVSNTNVLNSVCFSDAEHGWAVGSVGTILRTTNGGTSWTAQTSPTESNHYDVYCINDLTAVIVGDPGVRYSGPFGTILKTTNGGTTWAPQLSGSSTTLLSVFFVGSTGYAVGRDGAVYKSTDSGTSWTPRPAIASPSGIRASLNDIFCLDASTCWVSRAGGDDVLYETSDSGTSWTPHRTGITVAYMNGFHFKNEQEGYVGGQNVLLSTNTSGETWAHEPTDISNSLNLLSINAIHDVQCRQDVCWAVGDEGTILRLNEPLIAVVATPNVTATVVPECPAPLDDCEAGWDARPIYDDNNCIIDYECIRGNVSGVYTLTTEQFRQFAEFLSRVPGMRSNERINVYIDDEVWNVIIKNKDISINKGELEDSSFNIYLTHTVIDKVVGSEDKVNTALSAYKNKEIRIEAKTFGAKMRLVLMRIGLLFKKK